MAAVGAKGEASLFVTAVTSKSVEPVLCSVAAGVAVPIPTFPLANTVNPEPEVLFDWIRPTVPVVPVELLATYNSPFVEFKELFDVVILNPVPVVSEPDEIAANVPVVAELAVTLNNPVPVYAPEPVIPNAVPLVSEFVKPKVEAFCVTIRLFVSVPSEV